MRNTSSLDALLPKTRQGILAATLVQPDKAWYVSELARRMEVPPSSLQPPISSAQPGQAALVQLHEDGVFGIDHLDDRCLRVLRHELISIDLG
jgi:hypothetical protein